jgi:archaeal type IV pilus assembly protein PilA
MINYKLFVKNRKAISPIFATLILIAIAVIAGVVVYTFTSGTLSTMTGGGTAAQEKITVQASSYSGATTKVVTLYAQCTGGPAPVINSLIIKNSQGNTIETVTASYVLGAGTPTPSTMAQGTLYTIQGTLATALPTGTYTATLVTNAGGSFISPSFTV